jgi:chromosome segregation ATPase
MLMEHFEEISQAINDIGLIKSKEKKAQAIELISRYAPEMAKMKEQIKSVDRYVESLKGQIDDQKDVGRYWKGKTAELEAAIKERDGRLDELREKHAKLKKQLDLVPPELLDALAAQEKERRRLLKNSRGGAVR